jgi:hypothetical protein
VIRLRRKGAAKAAASSKRDRPAPREAATQGAAPDELDRLLMETAQTEDRTVESTTRVASVSEIRRMVSESVRGETDAGDEEWFVLVAGKQQGPIGRLAVLAMIERKEIDQRTYVWRDGMDEWQRLGNVADFEGAAEDSRKAAGRVLSPLDDDSSVPGPATGLEGATTAMDVSALREHIARTRGHEETSDPFAAVAKMTAPEPSRVMTEPATVVGDPLLIAEAKRAAAAGSFSDLTGDGVDEAPLDAVDDPTLESFGDSMLGPDLDDAAVAARDGSAIEQERDDREAMIAGNGLADPFAEAAPGVSGADLISALSGEPTGEGMTRTAGRDDTHGQLHAPESLSDYISDPRLGLDEQTGQQMAAQIAEELTGVEEPVYEPFDHLGPTFAEADEPRGGGLRDETGGVGAGYYASPPGESTRVFMATAGLYRRRRTHRIAALAGVLFSMTLVAVVSMDILGVFSIPGMGLVYDMTGLEDPNKERGIQRIEKKLQTTDLTEAERSELETRRAQMRGRLMGEASADDMLPRPGRRKGGRVGGGKAPVREGVKDDRSLTAEERSMAQNIFRDQSKRERTIDLAAPERIEAPNLPEGLTQKAILKVITTNSGSMNLCMTESLRKGESLDGRMDLTLTIAADGSVVGVEIDPPKLRNTVMGGCAKKRIRNWRFPAFNGDPIDVTYPYLLQTAM